MTHRAKTRGDARRKAPIGRLAVPMRTPMRECKPECTVSVRFRCGCRLELKDGQVTLVLPKDPTAGNRKRHLGHIAADGVLHIHRDGRDFLRARQVYGLNLHLLMSARALGFETIYCDTPTRGGYLPPNDILLQRKQFQYSKAGFEVQVGFAIKEIWSAA